MNNQTTKTESSKRLSTKFAASRSVVRRSIKILNKQAKFHEKVNNINSFIQHLTQHSQLKPIFLVQCCRSKQSLESNCRPKIHKITEESSTKPEQQPAKPLKPIMNTPQFKVFQRLAQTDQNKSKTCLDFLFFQLKPQLFYLNQTK